MTTPRTPSQLVDLAAADDHPEPDRSTFRLPLYARGDAWAHLDFTESIV